MGIKRISSHSRCLSILLLIVSALFMLSFVHHASLVAQSDMFISSSSFGLITDFARSDFDSSFKKSGDYIQDEVCSGCRHAFVYDRLDKSSRMTRCGILLHRLYNNQSRQNLSLSEAAKMIAMEHPNDCQQCYSCKPDNRRYWRHDRILPNSNIQSAWTMMLPSVPFKHRIPDSATTNITAYFCENENAYPHREYLFDYNPSIVVVPHHQRPAFAPTAAYLASFRVSNRHFCLSPSDRQLMMRGHKTSAQDWLGLALLDKDMAILQDAILDLTKSGFQNGGVEDYRLFLLPTLPSSKMQLYIASNDMIAPIWLQNAPIGSQLIPRVFAATDVSLVKHGWSVYIRPFVSCASCSKPRGLCGKNFNYFVNASGSIFAEIWPSSPHTSRLVNLIEPCQRQLEPAEQVMDETRTVPSSFATVEELYFPQLTPQQVLLTRGRGGACCVDMEHPHTGRSLLVGILHSKTPSQYKNRLPISSINRSIIDNHYLSRLYAFEPTAPYQIVALSGFFCLGSPDQYEQATVPLAKLTRWRKLILGQEFDCPRIHFVSGISLVEDDPSSALIAYGINDCVSRIVKVSMNQLRQLLFPTEN